MRGLVFAVCVAIAAAPAPSAAEPDGDRVDQVMQRSLDRVYQRDLPGYDAGGGEGGGDGRGGDGRGGLGRAGGSGDGRGSAGPHDGIERSRGAIPGDPRERRRLRYERNQSGSGDGGAFGGLATVLLWGLLILGAVILIAIVVAEASGMKGRDDPVANPGQTGEGPDRIAAVIERPRDDADQLAGDGRFTDAIHVLLLRTLHELASQNLVRVTPSMTSREVLARVPLLGDARTALAGLVSAVELTWFGDDVPGAPDYARCREQFELFATAYRRGAAPRVPTGARA